MRFLWLRGWDTNHDNNRVTSSQSHTSSKIHPTRPSPRKLQVGGTCCWWSPGSLHGLDGGAELCLHLLLKLIPAGRLTLPRQILSDQLLLLLRSAVQQHVELILRTKHRICFYSRQEIKNGGKKGGLRTAAANMLFFIINSSDIVMNREIIWSIKRLRMSYFSVHTVMLVQTALSIENNDKMTHLFELVDWLFIIPNTYYSYIFQELRRRYSSYSFGRTYTKKGIKASGSARNGVLWLLKNLQWVCIGRMFES